MKTNPTASTDIQGEPDAEEQIEVEESESITNIEERLKEVRPTKEGSQEVLDEKKTNLSKCKLKWWQLTVIAVLTILIIATITILLLAKEQKCDFSIEEVEKYCNQTGCDWTQQYACPWDTSNQNGIATADGTIGYYACCVSRLHVDEPCGNSVIGQGSGDYTNHMYYQFSKDEVEPYCEKDGCDWTQKYYCPWDIFNPSQEEAKDDGSLGYYACCVYRLHPAEACGYSVIYKDSVVQNGKHIISTDPEITRNFNARQLIASRSNTNPINYCDYVCQYTPRGTKNKDYDPCDLFFKRYDTCEKNDGKWSATHDCCCNNGARQVCGSDESEIAAAGKLMPNWKYSADDLSPGEKELIHEINKFCDKYDIFFHLLYTAGYDKDHMFPFTHVIPNNFFWYVEESQLDLRPGHFGFQRGDIRRNVDKLVPPIVYSRSVPGDVVIKSWQVGGDKMENRIEVSHGIDEDAYWANEGGGMKELKNLRYRHSLLFSTYAKKQRMKNQVKNQSIKSRSELKDIKDKDGKQCFTDGSKPYLLYIGTTSVAGENSPTLLSHGKNEKAFEKFEQGLKRVTEKYNVILRLHPNDKYKDLYADLYPKLCIQPDVHWAELSALVDGVLIESSGATFACMPNWYKKPAVCLFKKNGGPGAKPDYQSWKDKVLNETHCRPNTQTDDLVTSVKEAFEDFEDDLKKQNIIQARSDYFEKMFQFNITDVKYHRYDEFRMIIDIIKNLTISTKHEDYASEVENLYNLFIKMINNDI